MRLSIRWRLTLWNTLAIACVLVIFAALVYILFRQALYAQTDQLLQTALGQLQGDPRVATATDERIRYWVEEYRDHQRFHCAVFDADGSVHAATPDLAPRSVPSLPAVLERNAVYDADLPEVGRQRVMAERQRLGDRDFVVVLFTSLGTIDSELARMQAVLITSGFIALLMSAMLAYWLARHALAPIDRLRRETDAISAERLDERLSTSNPHDELGLLTRTINAMIARLERAFAEIRRFTADASHELRTPLTALRTEVEVALSRHLSGGEQQQLLTSLLEELGRLSRLTDQLLTLSRRDAGVEQFELTPVDLHAVVASVVDTLQPLAATKELQVKLRCAEEASIFVAGDEGRLRQVFINLLDNAFKYTPEGGSVSIYIARQDGSGTVTVTDTGIGIAQEHLPRVFERFYRLDKARTRAAGGTGLGLSIARSIVTAHGGTIEIASSLGKGSTCTVTLPEAHDARVASLAGELASSGRRQTDA
jgi:heavy metal sensor kinase